VSATPNVHIVNIPQRHFGPAGQGRPILAQRAGGTLRRSHTVPARAWECSVRVVAQNLPPVMARNSTAPYRFRRMEK
jgi:hypothetical protein